MLASDLYCLDSLNHWLLSESPSKCSDPFHSWQKYFTYGVRLNWPSYFSSVDKSSLILASSICLPVVTRSNLSCSDKNSDTRGEVPPYKENILYRQTHKNILSKFKILHYSLPHHIFRQYHPCHQRYWRLCFFFLLSHWWLAKLGLSSACIINYEGSRKDFFITSETSYLVRVLALFSSHDLK